MSDEDKAEKIPDKNEADEQEVKRPRRETSPIQINVGSRPLPNFVAGASPAKFITVDQLKEINDELANMAIAHEIALNPEFSVEDLVQKNTDALTKKVKEIATKAFYDHFRASIEEDPPDYEPFFSLYSELKKMALDIAPQAKSIIDTIDVDEPRRQHNLKCLDIRGLLLSFVDVMSKICAPVRDEEIANLRNVENVVELLKAIHVILDEMKRDMINFTVRQTRHQFLQHSATYEAEKFMKVLELYPDAANETVSWLEETLSEYCKTNGEIYDVTKPMLPKILSIAYARLLEGQRRDTTFPETLNYDMSRIEKFSQERLKLMLTLSAVFIGSNLAGKAVCDGTDFKKVLKTHIMAVVADANYENYADMLDSIYLQCNKELEEALPSQWNANYADLLKRQIEDLKNENNSIRKVVEERMFSIISAILIGPGAMTSSGSRLPPGLSVIESELVNLISRYLSVTIHNTQAFGEFYLSKLNILCQKRTASIPPPSTSFAQS